jgi:transposase
MKCFIQSTDRTQVSLCPEQLEDYVTDDNPVRVVDVFVDQLALGALGFAGVTPLKTGRLAYHPGRTAQTLHLRLPEPDSIQSSTGTRKPTKSGAHLVN